MIKNKMMFGFIKKMLIGLRSFSTANPSNHTKCVSLSNQRSVRSCNALNELSNKECVPSKTEDLNLSVFNMITGINESKTLTKHTSCRCKCKFDSRKCNSNQKWNNNKCRCECKNIIYVKKIRFGIMLHVVAKMVNI